MTLLVVVVVMAMQILNNNANGEMHDHDEIIYITPMARCMIMTSTSHDGTSGLLPFVLDALHLYNKSEYSHAQGGMIKVSTREGQL